MCHAARKSTDAAAGDDPDRSAARGASRCLRFKLHCVAAGAATVIRANSARRCAGLGLNDSATGAVLTGFARFGEKVRDAMRIFSTVKPARPVRALASLPSRGLPRPPFFDGRVREGAQDAGQIHQPHTSSGPNLTLGARA
jgi:hypothetical protein